MKVTEREVEVPTPDGVADAFFYEAEEPGRPGVIFLPDGFGSRPSQRQMARRIAELGYDVLLPNIYYRGGRAPFFDTHADINDPPVRARFMELTGGIGGPEGMVRDGSAYVDFFRGRKVAVVGFCFTGQFALRTAAARPDRVVAAASFHGGRLVQDDPSSAHLVLPRVEARLYFGHAKDDRSMPAEAIAKLEDALATWGGQYQTEVYNARHGWTVLDSSAYDEPEAERAFAKLRELLRASFS